MSIETVFIFFVVCYSLGHSLDLLLGISNKNVTFKIFRFGFGLAIIPVLAVILDAFSIPLHIYWFLSIGIIITAAKYYFIKNSKEISQSKDIPISHIVIVVLLSMVSLAMYLKGAFSYTYMEDGDSWLYTTVAKVIAENHTFSADYRYNHVSEPYTQGYQIILGLLHQTNDSIYWTVKFFNSVFAALSLPFFYVLALEVFKQSKNAKTISLASTFMIFAVPSWLTHHIYSMTLNATLLPLLFCALFRTVKDWRWGLIAGVLLGSLILNHFFTAFVSLILTLYVFVLALLNGKLDIKAIVYTFSISTFIALFFYIPSSFIRHRYYSDNPSHESHGGIEMFTAWFYENYQLCFLFILIAIVGLFLIIQARKSIARINKKTSFFLTLIISLCLFVIFAIPEQIIQVKGCCSRIYTLNDFLFPEVRNLMHNPIGWGMIYSIFVMIGLVYLIKQLWSQNPYGVGVFLLVNLFILTFFLAHGMRLSIGMMTFRMWTFMTVFSSLIAGYGLFKVINNVANKVSFKIRNMITIASLLGVTLTSYAVKYDINTMPWPDHELIIEPSHKLHAWVRDNLPKNSNVVNICRDSGYLTSYDMLPPITDKRVTPPWRQNHDPAIYEISSSLNGFELYKKLTDLNIEYIVVGFSCSSREEDREEIVSLVKRISASELFKKIHSSQSDVLLRVNK